MNEINTTNGKINKSELFSIYNKMRAAYRKAGDTKAIERLNRALGILQSRDYQGEAEYTTTGAGCTCKDWEYRNTNRRGTKAPCKHMMAAILIEKIMADREANLNESAYEARHTLESAYRI